MCAHSAPACEYSTNIPRVLHSKHNHVRAKDLGTQTFLVRVRRRRARLRGLLGLLAPVLGAAAFGCLRGRRCRRLLFLRLLLLFFLRWRRRCSAVTAHTVATSLSPSPSPSPVNSVWFLNQLVPSHVGHLAALLHLFIQKLPKIHLRQTGRCLGRPDEEDKGCRAYVGYALDWGRRARTMTVAPPTRHIVSQGLTEMLKCLHQSKAQNLEEPQNQPRCAIRERAKTEGTTTRTSFPSRYPCKKADSASRYMSMRS